MKRTNADYFGIVAIIISLLYSAYRRRLKDVGESDFLLAMAIVVAIAWSYAFYKDRIKKTSEDEV